MERFNYIQNKNLFSREDLIRHIQGINKHLTKVYLENLSNQELLCESHPVYRSDYEKAMRETSQKTNLS